MKTRLNKNHRLILLNVIKLFSEYEDTVDRRWLALFERSDENVFKIQDLNNTPVAKHRHSAGNLIRKESNYQFCFVD